MTPNSASFSRWVVLTLTESITASTATPASCFCSSRDMPSLIKRIDKLRIDLIQTLLQLLLLRCGIIRDCLEINRRDVKMRPIRHREREPMAERLQTEIKKPIRLPFTLDMNLITSSSRPGGTISVSISLVNPYLYSELAAFCNTSSCCKGSHLL